MGGDPEQPADRGVTEGKPEDIPNVDTFREELRMALAETSNNLRSGVAVIWDAFKTYFTVAGFLFAGFAFLQSSNHRLDGRMGWWFSLGLAIAGVLVTVLAGLSVRRIIKYQRAFLKYGTHIEKRLSLSLIETAKSVWGTETSRGSEMLTYFVYAAFGAAWVVLAGYCLLLPDQTLPDPKIPSVKCEWK